MNWIETDSMAIKWCWVFLSLLIICCIIVWEDFCVVSLMLVGRKSYVMEHYTLGYSINEVQLPRIRVFWKLLFIPFVFLWVTFVWIFYLILVQILKLKLSARFIRTVCMRRIRWSCEGLTSVHNEYTGYTLKHLLLRHMYNLSLPVLMCYLLKLGDSKTSYCWSDSGECYC